MAMDYVVSIKLKPDDEVTGAVKKLLDDVGSGVTKTTEAPTKAARNFVREFRDSFQQIGSAVRGFRGELAFLQNTYSTVSGVLGVGARDIVQTAVDWNSEMETMNLSLATVLSSVDRLDGGQFSDFQNAQKEVARLFGTIVEEAAATPVEFSDIVQTFTTILPLTRKLVPDMKELVRLSASLSTWDVIGNRRRGDTALDVRQILSGQLNPRLIQNPLLSAHLSELKSQFELMEKARKEGKSGLEEQAQLLRMVQQTLGMPDKARAALENSFEGMFNALKSEFKLLFTSGSSPVFEDLKNVIRGAREYLQAHPNEVRQMVREFSQFLFKAGEFLYGVFKFFYDNFDTIKSVFVHFMALWTSVNVIKFVAGLGEFARVMRAASLGDFFKAVAGLKSPAAAAAASAGEAGAAAAAIRSATFTVGGAVTIVAATVLLNEGGEQTKATNEKVGSQLGEAQKWLSNLGIDATKLQTTLSSTFPRGKETLVDLQNPSLDVTSGPFVEGLRAWSGAMQAWRMVAQVQAVQAAFQRGVDNFLVRTPSTDARKDTLDIRLEVTGTADAQVTSTKGPGNVTVNNGSRRVAVAED